MPHAHESKALRPVSAALQRLVDGMGREHPDSVRRRAIRILLTRARGRVARKLTDIAMAAKPGKVEDAVTQARSVLTVEFGRAQRLGLEAAGLGAIEHDDLLDDLAFFVEGELAFFREFARSVAGAEEQMGPEERGRMYGGSAEAMFWRAFVAALPSGARIFWRLGVAEHCVSCLSLSAASPYGLPGEPNPLPTVPRGGDTLCVVDPEARVTTGRGLVPIREIRAGDQVMTHRGRFRRVLKVAPSTVGARGVSLVAGGRRLFAVTDDHYLATPAGWRTAKDIGSRRLPVYTEHHVHLPQVHRLDPFRLEDPDVPAVPADLSGVWGEEGSPGGSVYFVRDVGEGEGAVANQLEDDPGRSQEGGHGEAASVLRSARGTLQAQAGRPVHRILLGGGRASLGVPVPVAVGAGERPDPGGYGSASPGSRSSERRGVQPGADDQSVARLDAHDHRSEGGDAAAAGNRIAGQAAVDMRELRSDIRGVPQGQEAASVLLSGLPCPPSTPCWDLVIEEDHSFICEGVILHNCLTNCRCSLHSDAVPGALFPPVGVEITGMGELDVDPTSPAALAAAGPYLDLAERYAWLLRLSVLDPSGGYGRAAALVRQGIEDLARAMGHRWRMTLTDPEITAPARLARRVGLVYRAAEDLDDDLVLAVAVVIAMNHSDRGKISSVSPDPPMVTLDDQRSYQLDGEGRAILLLEEDR